MCRFAAYLGPEIFISSLVTEPKHSIIHQSYHAKEREEPLNGDGYGISWFAPSHCGQPAIFKEVSPAWNSPNLRNIARVTKSNCIFAHVRAATVGGQVSRPNCHPFSWGNYAFMHNGTVFDFSNIKRKLRESLSDEAYSNISGHTDSEHIFALFTDEIKDLENPTLQEVADALLKVIQKLESLKKLAGVNSASTLNLVVSDGKKLVATRYISEGENSNSLYLLRGESFSCHDGICKMEKGEGMSLIASEPLDQSSSWEKIPNNHYVMIEQNKTFEIKKMEF